jgi:flagellar hook-basal body complex protein FliE
MVADIRFSQASNAYANALKTAERILQQTSLPGATTAPSKADGPSFADMVGNSLSEAKGMGYKSEDTAKLALMGKADMTDVVTAISQAETALTTVVAIRDRVINAYQDIIKMPI